MRPPPNTSGILIAARAIANLFSCLLIEISLRVNVTQRHAEVRVDVPGASLPARHLLLQAEDLLRKLEAEVAELL